MPKLNSVCIFCDKKYEYYYSTKKNNVQKYCSNDCRIEHKKQLAGFDKEQTCVVCNKTYFPERQNQKTCSKECGKILSTENRKGHFKFVCENCGIDFERRRSRKRSYCSQECYFELIGDIAKEWKKERICIECNELYTPIYKIQRYCSRSCSMIVIGREKTEKGTVFVNCDWCQKEIRKRLTQLGKENNFCSTDCSYEFFIKKFLHGNVNYLTGCVVGYFLTKKYLKPIFFRSSYEFLALEILENDNNIIYIEPEPFYIKYIYQNNTKKYIPDLLIKTQSNISILIEIKPKRLIDNEINILKMQAAKEYCKKNNIKYLVWTEENLGI